MPRGEQVARFYSLVMDLAAARHGVPAAVLARRYGLRLRTVYRDLHALEQAGFPLARSEGARWKLVDGWQRRLPFPLRAGELLALHVAAQLMAPLRGTPLARDFQALFVRLAGPDGTRPPGQGELFPRYRQLLATRSALAIDYTAHEAVLERLCRACETRTTVRAAYWVESRGEMTHRRIDPYCLYYDPQLEALYVFAWCHLRAAMRTFAVHRFRQVTLTEQRFAVPADFSAEGYLRRAFRLWRGEHAVRVRLRLERDAAGWVTERRWHASQKTRRLPGGRAELELTVDGTREVERFILGLGAACEVLEPGWLRERIAREHRRAAGLARGGPKRSVTSDDTALRHRRAR